METKRLLIFLVGCIGTRLALAMLAIKLSPGNLKWMGMLALVPTIGWITIYLLGLRKTGVEVNGEPIWWDRLRPIHASLYLWFSLWAMKGNPNSWVPLLIDVTFGLAAFSLHHYGK